MDQSYRATTIKYMIASLNAKFEHSNEILNNKKYKHDTKFEKQQATQDENFGKRHATLVHIKTSSYQF